MDNLDPANRWMASSQEKQKEKRAQRLAAAFYNGQFFFHKGQKITNHEH